MLNTAPTERIRLAIFFTSFNQIEVGELFASAGPAQYALIPKPTRPQGPLHVIVRRYFLRR